MLDRLVITLTIEDYCTYDVVMNYPAVNKQIIKPKLLKNIAIMSNNKKASEFGREIYNHLVEWVELGGIDTYVKSKLRLNQFPPKSDDNIYFNELFKSASGYLYQSPNLPPSLERTFIINRPISVLPPLFIKTLLTNLQNELSIDQQNLLNKFASSLGRKIYFKYHKNDYYRDVTEYLFGFSWNSPKKLENDYYIKFGYYALYYLLDQKEPSRIKFAEEICISIGNLELNEKEIINKAIEAFSHIKSIISSKMRESSNEHITTAYINNILKGRIDRMNDFHTYTGPHSVFFSRANLPRNKKEKKLSVNQIINYLNTSEPPFGEVPAEKLFEKLGDKKEFSGELNKLAGIFYDYIISKCNKGVDCWVSVWDCADYIHHHYRNHLQPTVVSMDQPWNSAYAKNDDSGNRTISDLISAPDPLNQWSGYIPTTIPPSNKNTFYTWEDYECKSRECIWEAADDFAHGEQVCASTCSEYNDRPRRNTPIPCLSTMEKQLFCLEIHDKIDDRLRFSYKDRNNNTQLKQLFVAKYLEISVEEVGGAIRDLRRKKAVLRNKCIDNYISYHCKELYIDLIEEGNSEHKNMMYAQFLECFTDIACPYIDIEQGGVG